MGIDAIDERSNARLFRGIFCIALATLLFEIALTRILSFTIWYHFAYVAISTALLGYGASGTLLAVRPLIGTVDTLRTLRRCAACAAASIVGVLAVIILVPLDPMRITSSAPHAFAFCLYLGAVTVPFFFSGLAISLSLRAAAERVDRLYFWDLVGAGLGAAVAVPLMNALSPPGAALTAAAVFLGAGATFSPLGRRMLPTLGFASLLVLAPFAEKLHFRPADSKHLALLINFQRMTPVFERWTALFRTDVVSRSENTPRPSNEDEWGLSSVAPDVKQHPWGFVNHDGTAGTGIYDMRGGSLDFLDFHVLRTPYLLLAPGPRVLVIGVGGGRDVVAALRFGASRVTGVELDPVTINLLRNDTLGVSGSFFRDDRIRLVADEGRHFVRSSGEVFDLIQITGVDTLAAQSSGMYVLAENYLYTREALSEYLDHLTPNGVLCITTGHLRDDRPMSSGRMVSVAREALAARGVARPADHIAVINSRHFYADVLVKPSPFTPGEVDALERQAKDLAFRVLWLPGRPSQRVFSGLAQAEGQERQELLARLPYLVDATTDDTPFFFRSYRWSELSSERLGPDHTTALGQLVLLLLLVSLSLLGAILVLGPLVVFRRRDVLGTARQRWGILSYFLAIGLGFMLFEISLMQRFVLFLGYPTYSLTVTLSSLLVSLGLGSFLSRRWLGRERWALPAAVVGLGLMTLFYRYGLPILQSPLLSVALPLRVAFTAAALTPLGLIMGAFFPLGIRSASAVHHDLVPWAWGINGCASVTGTVLAVVLAMTFGFAWVWSLSIIVYALGVAALLGSGALPLRASERA